MSNINSVGTSSPYVGMDHVIINWTTDNDVTVVSLTVLVGDEIYDVAASSKCDPTDTPDTDIGYPLALGRALRQVGREILSDANAEVNRRDDIRKNVAERNKVRREAKLKRAAEIKARLASAKNYNNNDTVTQALARHI